MAKFQPTPAQKLAIETRGGSILVSAAAGSGKTRVLTQRLAAWVTDPEHPQDIDRFLVITYTRAAAAELRGRILNTLSDLAAADPGNPRLRRQSTLCCRAHIETIHSFCAGLLREHCHNLGLAPDFRVAEEERSAQIRERVLERCLEMAYETIDTDPGFRSLVDTVGAGRDDARLAGLLLELHAQMQSHPDPAAWAASQRQALYANGAQDLAETPWGRELLENAATLAEYWAAALEEVLTRLAQGSEAALAAYGESLAETIEALRLLAKRAPSGWEAARACLPIPFPRLKAIRGEKPPEAQWAQQRREVCKKAITHLEKQIFGSSASLLADLRATAPAMEALLVLVVRFDAWYAREKRRLNLVDFSDLEHMSLQLLWDEEKQAPTVMAREVSQRFTEILVDEYQDVNAVQDLLFHCLSRGGKNLFLVGDVKQSIYRFRLADPGIFLDKYARARPVGTEGASIWRIDLQENFRSRGCVLDACNQVFTALMSLRLGELEYDEAAALRLGATYYPNPDQERPVRLRVLTPSSGDERAEGTGADREARYVAKEIRRLVQSGDTITVDGETRPVGYGDVAILLRAPGGSGFVYRKALQEAGIPLATDQGEGFFSSLEITVLLSLLAIIDNPHQDVPLLSVLRSPFFGFSPEDLAEIRAASRKGDFYTALCVAGGTEPRCRDFLEFINNLRKLAPDLPPDALLQRIYSQRDLFAICAAMPSGQARVENLQALLQLALQFQQTGQLGLHAFVWWLRRRQARGDGPAGSRAEGVQIISIHRSKGLEFPVVFLADTARRFNLRDASQTVLVHPVLGLGPKRVDTDRRLEYPTVARQAIAARLRRETLSEELRVLYVAMTRAREQLTITCTMELPEISPGPPAAEELLADGSMAAWLIRAAMLPNSPIDLAAVMPETEAREEEKNVQSTALEETALPDTTALDWIYPHGGAVALPSKLTATELKQVTDKPDPEARPLLSPGRRSFRRPFLRREERPLSPAERGTATHLALQYLNFAKTDSREALTEELARLEALGLLTPAQAAAVDIRQLSNFFQGPLGQRILVADQVWREQRFSILCEAERWYPAAVGEKILLQGMVDCCFLEGGELTVLDYKTDIVADGNWQARAERYRIQLETYSMAMTRILDYPVKQGVLYFLQGGFPVVFDEIGRE